MNSVDDRIIVCLRTVARIIGCLKEFWKFLPLLTSRGPLVTPEWKNVCSIDVCSQKEYREMNV